jgi:voltage-gated potassium channel
MSDLYSFDDVSHRLRWRESLALFTGTLLIGTLGYSLLESWPLRDSLYMTLITISTVGYGETQPLSGWGRMFTGGLIVLSIGSMTFLTAMLTSFIVENSLDGSFWRRRTMRSISQLKGHTIICGASPMAAAIIQRLMQKRREVVLIEADPRRIAAFCQRWRRLLVIEGDATNELTLASANLLEAAHVIAALDSEMDNLLVAITCKDVGPQIKVHAQSDDSTIANRMRKAAVDQVVSSGQIVGDYVADSILA